MSQSQSFDASIPVLTEVFQDQPVKAEPAPAADAVPPAPAPAPLPGPPEAALEAEAIEHWDAPAWAVLERRLSERILQQLQGRVDFVLEQRLRDSMEEVLKHAIDGLADEIRLGLQQTIEKIVVRAVSQEIAHLQTLKK
jgi:hypothetical protein